MQRPTDEGGLSQTHGAMRIAADPWRSQDRSASSPIPSYRASAPTGRCQWQQGNGAALHARQESGDGGVSRLSAGVALAGAMQRAIYHLVAQLDLQPAQSV